MPDFPPPHAENCTFLRDSWGSLPENLPHILGRCLFFCHHFKMCGRESCTPRVPKKTVPGFLPPIGLLVVETRPPPLRIYALFACCKKLGGSYSAISGRSIETVPELLPPIKVLVVETRPWQAMFVSGSTCQGIRISECKGISVSGYQRVRVSAY